LHTCVSRWTYNNVPNSYNIVTSVSIRIGKQSERHDTCEWGHKTSVEKGKDWRIFLWMKEAGGNSQRRVSDRAANQKTIVHTQILN